MTISKSNAMLVVVVVMGMAVASVVVTHGRANATGSQSTATTLADTSLSAQTTSAVDPSDPAQTVPTLNQFKSRDPFIQVTDSPAPSTSSQVTDSPAPSTSSSPSEKVPVSADVKIQQLRNSHASDVVSTHTYKTAKVGEKLQPVSGGPVFEITEVGSSGIKISVVGYQLSQNTVPEGQASVVDLQSTSGTTSTNLGYWAITVLSTNEGSSSGGSSGTSATTTESDAMSPSPSPSATNAEEALNIGVANGSPCVTMSVDGTTYSPQKIGSVLQTNWGQVKILGINSPAHTVTVLHGDEQLTLAVGDPVSQ